MDKVSFLVFIINFLPHFYISRRLCTHLSNHIIIHAVHPWFLCSFAALTGIYTQNFKNQKGETRTECEVLQMFCPEVYKYILPGPQVFESGRGPGAEAREGTRVGF